MKGFEWLIVATTWEQAAFEARSKGYDDIAELFDTKALEAYYSSALNENERRARNDAPDNEHLTYL